MTCGEKMRLFCDVQKQKSKALQDCKGSKMQWQWLFKTLKSKK